MQSLFPRLRYVFSDIFPNSENRNPLAIFKFTPSGNIWISLSYLLNIHPWGNHTDKNFITKNSNGRFSNIASLNKNNFRGALAMHIALRFIHFRNQTICKIISFPGTKATVGGHFQNRLVIFTEIWILNQNMDVILILIFCWEKKKISMILKQKSVVWSFK
jgi:hypothetical protein